MSFDDGNDLKKIFDFFEKKYKESVGIMFGVVETDEIEMDIVRGEESSQVLGIRIYQFLGNDQDDEKGPGGEPVDAGSDDDDDADEEGEECEEEQALVYDFIAANSKAKLAGTPWMKIEVSEPSCNDDDEEATEKGPEETPWVRIVIHARDGKERKEITGLELTYISSSTSVTFVETDEVG